MHVNKTTSILKMIQHRKHNGTTEHIRRYEGFLHDITEEKMIGKYVRGRRRTELLHKMEHMYN